MATPGRRPRWGTTPTRLSVLVPKVTERAWTSSSSAPDALSTGPASAGRHTDPMTAHTTVWPNGVPQVGDRAELSRTIQADDIVRFTQISGDFNPLHYDADVAARTRFEGIVVQGGVTSAVLNAVVAEKLPGPGTVFLETHWRFLAPCRPGDVITGQVEVTSVREDKPITTLDTRVVRGDGVVAIEGTAVCWTMDLDPG